MRISRHCKRWRQCALCLAGVDGKGHREEYERRYHDSLRRKEDDEVGIRKPDVVKEAERVFGRDRSSDDWLLYPTLMEYLAEERYEDGTPRRTSTVTLFFAEGSVKLSLNDRDLDRVAFVTSTTIEGCLGILESKLKESSIEWRASQGGGGKRKK